MACLAPVETALCLASVKINAPKEELSAPLKSSYKSGQLRTTFLSLSYDEYAQVGQQKTDKTVTKLPQHSGNARRTTNNN